MTSTESALTPFEPGAPAPTGGIPLCVPELRGNEWKYIKECLDTNWVSSAGPFVDRFERMVAGYVGTRYGIATVNGTSALHLALLVAGIQPDDEVLVPSLSFIAPANAVRYAGAWPVFMDAEPEYWQMDAQKVLEFLKKECRWRNGALYNKTSGRPVKAILPVHVLGHPCDMDPLLNVARKYNLRVIEDGTESLGAKYKGRMVGHVGDLACFSFNGNKIITTGGGGMIVTDDEDWANKARYLSTQAKDDPLEYVHHEIGYNYRLTSIQASIGLAQMEQLDHYIAAKRSIAANYAERLRGIKGIVLPLEAKWANSVYWLYTVLVSPGNYGLTSRELIHLLSANGIQARPLWRAIHLQRPYANATAYRIEVASQLCDSSVSLPSSVGLSVSDLERVTTVIRKRSCRNEASCSAQNVGPGRALETR